MNTMLNQLSWPLADFQLGATLLLGLALGGVWWSRQPARRVALGWAATLALIVLGVAATLPTWPRWRSVHPVSAPAPARAQSPIVDSAFPEPLPSRPEPEYASSPASNDSPHKAMVFHTPTTASLLPWLTRVFLLGAGAMSLWLLLGVIEAIWLCRTARPAPGSLLKKLSEIQADHARLPRLLLSSRIHNAVALGILQPTILLPAALAEQADEQSLRAVLAHEMAHIRNRDLWLLGMMRGLLIVLFPHPFYWMIRRLIRDSQEALADAVAAQSRENDYAEGLVSWMRQVTNPRPVRVAAAMGIWERRSELSRRIGLLLDETFTVQTSLSHRWRLGMVASIGMAALLISLLTVRPASATNPDPMLSAQSGMQTNPPTEMLPIQIYARSTRFFMESNIWVYHGNVRVDNPQMKLTCESLTLETPKLTNGNHFRRATAVNVAIDWVNENGPNHATADKAVYTYVITNLADTPDTTGFETNALVVLTGHPTVTNRSSIFQADPLYWNLINQTITSPNKATTTLIRTETNTALNFTGRVIDKFTRAPVEGATVHVKRDIYTSTERRALQETEHLTDTNGQFKFSLTPEQATNVHLYLDFEVTHPKYTRRPWDGYALSMIRKNESLGEQPFFQQLDIAPAEGISGTVLNPDGTAASGIKILVYSKANKNDWAEYGSFDDTLTDASGRFTINAAKGGEAVLWLLPQEYSPSTHLIHQQRGDLGRFTLENGIRLSGQVFDSEGQPVSNVWINAEISGGPAKQNIGMPVADALRRSALTDENGKFAMGPLPAGDYDLLTSEYPRDNLVENPTRYPEPDVFLHQKLSLEAGQSTQTVQVRAVPHILVGIQQLDGHGQPHKSHEINFFGQLGGATWWGTGRPDDNGRITMKVPKGLTNAQFDLMVNEHQSTRYRWSDDAPWRNEQKMRATILDQDTTNISVTYYTSPILLVRALAPDGSSITNFKCAVTYPEGRKPYDHRYDATPHWISGTTGDINFEKQQDGRWRSEGLLPDEKVQLTVEADGYQSWTNSVTLPQGATKEVVARLEP